MDSRFFILLNQLRVEVGRTTTNVESNTTRVMLSAATDQPGVASVAFSKKEVSARASRWSS